MAKIDLSVLSAPVEALRADVEAAYHRLDLKWAEIAAQLKQLPIPCTVGYRFSENPAHPEDYDCLEWRKFNGKKRVCIVSYRWEHDPYGISDTSVSITPYEEWSGEQRVYMLEHVPKLFEEAVKQVKEFISKTEV